MSVSQYCNRDTISIADGDNALDAAKLMRKHHTGTLVVVSEEDDKRIPLGLLGESALVTEVLARGTDPKSVTAAELMQPMTASAREDEAVWAVVERMREHDQRRLAITDSEGSLLGLLVADDILELLAAGLVDIATLTRESPPSTRRASKRGPRKKPARKPGKKAAKQKPVPESDAPAEGTQG